MNGLPVVIVFLVMAGGLLFLLAACWLLPRAKKSAAMPGACFVLIFKDQEEVVEEIIRRFFSSLAWQYPEAEVVVVDNASRDDTGAILERMAGHYGFRLVTLQDKDEICWFCGLDRKKSGWLP